MGHLTFANRWATARTDEVLLASDAAGRYEIIGMHLSVPAGQNAQIKMGSETIASTETQLSLSGFGRRSGRSTAVTVTSSGAVSVTLIYKKGD